MKRARSSCFFMVLLIVIALLAGDVLSEKREVERAVYDIEVDLDKLLEKDSVSADTSHNDPGSIDVAAFNVQVFGRTKMSNQFVADYLAKIILRYDLILIQEIRDSSGRAINQLLSQVNSKSGSVTYAMVISDRLGRTSSKEQYAFIYRTDVLGAASNYVYDDSANDVFQREPFVVKFTSPLAAVSSFVAIGIHTAPTDAPTEIDHLVDVYDDAVTKTGTKDAIIMGDFNAGCTYINDWSTIRLATDRRFYWLINDVTDTTSKSTECAYDRFVIAGTKMLDAIEPLATGVFRFDREYKLTYDQATKVSDHYPVQMKLQSKEDFDRLSLKRLIEIDDKGSVTGLPTPPLTTTLTTTGFSLIQHFSITGVLQGFTVKSSLSPEADSVTKIDQLHSMMGEFISIAQVHAAKRHLNEISMVKYLPKNNGYYQTLHDYYKTVPYLYVVMAKCEMAKKRCILAIDVENAF